MTFIFDILLEESYLISSRLPSIVILQITIILCDYTEYEKKIMQKK